MFFFLPNLKFHLPSYCTCYPYSSNSKANTIECNYNGRCLLNRPSITPKRLNQAVTTRDRQAASQINSRSGRTRLILPAAKSPSSPTNIQRVLLYISFCLHIRHFLEECATWPPIGSHMTSCVEQLPYLNSFSFCTILCFFLNHSFHVEQDAFFMKLAEFSI